MNPVIDHDATVYAIVVDNQEEDVVGPAHNALGSSALDAVGLMILSDYAIYVTLVGILKERHATKLSVPIAMAVLKALGTPQATPLAVPIAMAVPNDVLLSLVLLY